MMRIVVQRSERCVKVLSSRIISIRLSWSQCNNDTCQWEHTVSTLTNIEFRKLRLSCPRSLSQYIYHP